MDATVFNPAQQHLLKMFSYAKDEKALEEIKRALALYFAQRVEEGMDELWADGTWSQVENESVLREHLRTSYDD